MNGSAIAQRTRSFNGEYVTYAEINLRCITLNDFKQLREIVSKLEQQMRDGEKLNKGLF
jgi:hypothetical protein